MSVFTKLGKIFGGGAMEVVKKGSEIVEKWVPTVEKKHEMATDIDKAIHDSIEAARKSAVPPGSTNTWFDSFVDGLNRMVRPTVTLFLFGGVAGFWALPKIGEVDPIVLSWTGTVFLFWFGGRAIFKDLPGVIAYLRETRGGK